MLTRNRMDERTHLEMSARAQARNYSTALDFCRLRPMCLARQKFCANFRHRHWNRRFLGPGTV